MKPSTLNELIEVYSKWRRKSLADENGIVKCFVCGKLMRWQDANVLHWVKCRHTSTRFEPDNTNVGCQIPCNEETTEAMANLYQAMLERYGIDRMDQLIKMSKVEVHLTDNEARELISKYRTLLKKLN